MNLVKPETLKSYFLSRDAVSELIEESKRVADLEKREIAAFNGGHRAFGSADEIKRAADADRADLAARTDALVADARQHANAYFADIFHLRPQVAAELAPLLQARLSDDDLRSLAQQHRDYTSLRMIAGCDCSFSKELSRRLDSYRAGVDAEVDRALRLARSAVVNTPPEGSVFNSRNCWGGGVPIDVALENIDSLNESFDAWLDGAEAPSDPLFRAVMANA